MVTSPLMSHPLCPSQTIDNILINEVTEFKFLGVTIANKLKWISYIDIIHCKISVLTGILFELREKIILKCMRQIYLSLIHPHLQYCSAIWGGAYTTYIDNLLVS